MDRWRVVLRWFPSSNNRFLPNSGGRCVIIIGFLRFQAIVSMRKSCKAVKSPNWWTNCKNDKILKLISFFLRLPQRSTDWSLGVVSVLIYISGFLCFTLLKKINKKFPEKLFLWIKLNEENENLSDLNLALFSPETSQFEECSPLSGSFAYFHPFALIIEWKSRSVENFVIKIA